MLAKSMWTKGTAFACPGLVLAGGEIVLAPPGSIPASALAFSPGLPPCASGGHSSAWAVDDSAFAATEVAGIAVEDEGVSSSLCGARGDLRSLLNTTT